ncbi:MAG: hypothetical protein WCN95_15630 [bacterium]
MKRYSKTLLAALAAGGMTLIGTGCNKPAAQPAGTEQPASKISAITPATNAPAKKDKPASEHPTSEHPHS